MPSIRVKGQVCLEDALLTNDHTQGELPGSGPSTYSRTPNVQPKRSLPLLPHGLLDANSPPSHLRPRSSTISSRIHTHCINTLSRNLQHAQPDPLRDTNTPSSNIANATPFQEMTIRGAAADLRVPSRADPGIVESSISISSFKADDADPRRSEFSDHHHDDVVEHLDVIGILPFLFPPQISK